MSLGSAHHILVKLSDQGQTLSSDDEDIRGRRVLDRNGEQLGRIQNLLVDQTHHRVRMLRIEHGGVLGIGATASFVPVEAIARITDDVVHIDQTHERIAGAPRYDPEVVPAPAAYSELYAYYAYPPFWGSL
ncbi:Sporulation protein YlmC, PRC-barrel domain family [Jatrophihabitans endophyticus]|uniref:Sporulation protein YlmC, PRC-barrel domain family n=1 Tax=Jatrophihabitans endophyticus TaxID=1206085 RepID=A0A1M5IRR0_9ACTN|nr:PRC-barrel domain-containing protein [Jatrophihabitans endophyticus]SHG30941.1 Sporulation protein YlmC, PRC-barrel domain family [Jatrophihabitans endophyticus]